MSTSTVEVRIAVVTGKLPEGVSDVSGREVRVLTTLVVVLGTLDVMRKVVGSPDTVGVVVKLSLEDMCGVSVVSKFSDIISGVVGIRGTLTLDSVVVSFSDTMLG